MEKYSSEELRTILANGFSKELIASELQIPIETLNQLTMQQRKNTQSQDTQEYLKEKRRQQIALKVRKMKERYNLLYNSCDEISSKDSINDLEELEKLYKNKQKEAEETRKGNGKKSNGSYLMYHSQLINLELRINRLKNEKMRTELNHPSANIEEIIQQLVTGTLRDIQQAEEVIDSEARKRLQQGNSSKFALTQEQQKQKIFMQIRSILKERAEEFHIENPEITIRQMHELIGGSLLQCVQSVVENLLARNETEKAKKVCLSFAELDKENAGFPINVLQNRIKNAEFGNLILSMLKGRNISEELQAKIIKRIEEGIARRTIDLSSIRLGTNRDGSKNITLRDVYKDARGRILE